MSEQTVIGWLVIAICVLAIISAVLLVVSIVIMYVAKRAKAMYKSDVNIITGNYFNKKKELGDCQDKYDELQIEARKLLTENTELRTAFKNLGDELVKVNNELEWHLTMLRATYPEVHLDLKNRVRVQVQQAEQLKIEKSGDDCDKIVTATSRNDTSEAAVTC